MKIISFLKNTCKTLPFILLFIFISTHILSSQNIKNDTERNRLRALQLSYSTNDLQLVWNNEDSISKLYARMGDLKNAHAHFLISDSVKNLCLEEEKNKIIGRIEMKNELEMTEFKNKSALQEKLNKEKGRIKRRNFIQSSMVVIILIVLSLGVFFTKNFISGLPKIILGKELNQPAIATGLLFITSMLFFETMLVYLDPLIDKITDGAPMWKILLSGLFACLIFPVNSYLEKILMKRMTVSEEKNQHSKFTLFVLIISLISSYFIKQNAGFAQNSKVDSLKKITNITQNNAVHNYKSDTTLVNILCAISKEFLNSSTDSAILYAEKAMKIAIKIKWHKGIGNSHNMLGNVYYDKGNFKDCQFHWEKALKIRKQLNDKVEISSSLNNMGALCFSQGNYTGALSYYSDALEFDSATGNFYGIATELCNLGIIYHEQGDLPKALSFYFRALEIDSSLNSKEDMAAEYANIGTLYKKQKDYSKALAYFQKAYMLDSITGNLRNMAIQLGNIGVVYDEKGDYPKALYYIKQALDIDSVLGNKSGIARHHGNLGIVYKSMNNHLNAFAHYFLALKMDSTMGNKSGIATHLGNIGSLWAFKGEYYKAEQYLLKALAIDTSIGRITGAIYRYRLLSHIYSKMNRFDLAYHHDTLYAKTQNSLFSLEKNKTIGRIEMKHEMEMQTFRNKLIKKKQEKLFLEIRERRNRFQYSSILIGIFILVSAAFILSRHKISGTLMGLLIFVPFLILFESLLNVLDPQIENITRGAPFFKIMINFLLALIIYFMHEWSETKLKRILKLNYA